MIRREHADRAEAMFRDVQELINISGCPSITAAPASDLDRWFQMADPLVRLGLQDKVHRVQYAWEQSTQPPQAPERGSTGLAS
jgi:hypothetical protein